MKGVPIPERGCVFYETEQQWLALGKPERHCTKPDCSEHRSHHHRGTEPYTGRYEYDSGVPR